MDRIAPKPRTAEQHQSVIDQPQNLKCQYRLPGSTQDFVYSVYNVFFHSRTLTGTLESNPIISSPVERSEHILALSSQWALCAMTKWILAKILVYRELLALTN